MRKIVNVLAEERWNDTNIDVEIGQSVTARASGTWTDGGVKTDALGFERLRLAPWKWTRRCRPARWFELVAVIGQYDGPYHRIARDGGFTASRAGRLYLFANDAWLMYWNNEGAVTVEIDIG